MLVVGVVLLFVFAVWDFKFASRPVIPFRFVRNRTVVIGSLVGFFDFVRSQYSGVDIVNPNIIYIALFLPHFHLSLCLCRRRQALVPC